MINVTCAMVCIINFRLKSDPLRLDNLDTLISATIGNFADDIIIADYYCDYDGEGSSHHYFDYYY